MLSAWVESQLTLLLAVATGIFLNHVEPQFPHPKSEEDKCTYFMEHM